jgi:hypothetical protein
MDPTRPNRQAFGVAHAAALASAFARSTVLGSLRSAVLSAPFGLILVVVSCSSSSSAPPPAPKPLPPGQFGASCLPTGGEQGNTECDVANGFACYGTSPTDANAFCTRFDCKDDASCAPGWWCKAVNVAPNVTTAKATFGMTRSVCLPRDYCAPCQSDRDCPTSLDGAQQHCTADAQGTRYCSPECATDANCNLDAACVNWQSVCMPAAGSACHSDDDCPPSTQNVAQHCQMGQCTPECAGDRDCAGAQGSGGATCQWRRLCAPRAGVCVGDGTLCSPCRSDDDCKAGGGYCVDGAPYSKERFCTQKATVASCDTTTTNPPGCPTPSSKDNWVAVACLNTPANQCQGLVTLGASTGQTMVVPGCWTVNR